MSPQQARAIGEVLAASDADEFGEFVQAHVQPTTDEHVRLACTMCAMSSRDEAEGRNPVTLLSSWTESGDVHDFVLIVADAGDVLASFEVQ